MITEFKKEYSWLSNFAEVEITIRGLKFASIEHAYMSEKNNSKEWKTLCSKTCFMQAGFIKKLSKNIILREDWADVKLKVMEYCIEQKFKQEPFKQKLLNTKDEIIQEGNYWNDKFWGVCLKTNEGSNYLGQIIMAYRSKLK